MSIGYTFIKAEDGKWYRGAGWNREGFTIFVDDGDILARPWSKTAKKQYRSYRKIKRRLIELFPGAKVTDYSGVIVEMKLPLPLPVPDKFDECYDERPDKEGYYLGMTDEDKKEMKRDIDERNKRGKVGRTK